MKAVACSIQIFDTIVMAIIRCFDEDKLIKTQLNKKRFLFDLFFIY